MNAGTFSGYIRRHVLGLVAVFFALGGTALALPRGETVGTDDIRHHAVTKPKLAPGAVTGDKVENRSLRGKDLRESTLNFGTIQARVKQRCKNGEAIRALTGDGEPLCVATGGGDEGPQGPPGPQGERGPQGPAGPATGPAGGDLTGTYPNPQIAAEAVADFPFWSLQGNAGTTAGTDFVGTTDDEPLELHVDSTQALRLEPAGSTPNLIGGSTGNSVTGGAVGATIGGGDSNELSGDFGTLSGGLGSTVAGDTATIGGGDENEALGIAATIGGGEAGLASGNHATIGGGLANEATGVSAAVGGGESNGASGVTAAVGGGFTNNASGSRATVAGGLSNTATADSATIGGGANNTASGISATVAGGGANTATGTGATVPGGSTNSAGGDVSFAAGFRAEADHDGAFVWADLSDALPLPSVAANEFAARATGGFRFVTAIDGAGATTAECTIDPAANLACDGSISGTSDRAAKSGFEPVDTGAVLDGVAELPLSTWSFRDEPGVRHLGPTAQDFRAAFGGLGADERHIATVDADGVALAAIKELEAVVDRQGRRIEALRARVGAR